MLEEEEYQFAMSQSCQGTMVFCKESFNTKVWGGGPFWCFVFACAKCWVGDMRSPDHFADNILEFWPPVWCHFPWPPRTFGNDCITCTQQCLSTTWNAQWVDITTWTR